MKEVAIISANFGDYDEIYENNEIINKDKFDWYLFSDTEKKSEFWNIINADYHLNSELEGKNSIKNIDKNFENMMIAKYYKLQTHKIDFLKDYKYLVWIDSSISILNNNFVNDLLNILKDDSIELISFIHPERNWIGDEGHVSIYKIKYKTQDILFQVQKYIEEGFDQKNLYACGFICRKNNEKLCKIFDQWWYENLNYSFQDQISFPYVLWKNNQKIDYVINENIYHNNFLGRVNYPHKK